MENGRLETEELVNALQITIFAPVKSTKTFLVHRHLVHPDSRPYKREVAVR